MCDFRKRLKIILMYHNTTSATCRFDLDLSSSRGVLGLPVRIYSNLMDNLFPVPHCGFKRSRHSVSDFEGIKMVRSYSKKERLPRRSSAAITVEKIIVSTFCGLWSGHSRVGVPFFVRSFDYQKSGQKREFHSPRSSFLHL